MTDESLNLDIANIKFLDLRRKRKSYRRIGKAPPDQVNVKITVQSYEEIRSLAYAVGLRHSPFYEELEYTLESIIKLKEDLYLSEARLTRLTVNYDILTKEFESAKLVIAKYNDQGVI